MSSRKHRRLFFFLYHAPVPDLKDNLAIQVHRLRDVLAAHHLAPLLAGCTFAGTIINPPKAHRRADAVLDCTPELKDTDVLLLPTRPPIYDELREKQGKTTLDSPRSRAIDRSGTGLETAVLDSLTSVFSECVRHEVDIWPALTPNDPTAEDLRMVAFQVNMGGLVRTLGTRGDRREPEDKRLALGYVAAIPPGTYNQRELPGRVLNVFSLGGAETLWFSLYLSKFRGILKNALECTAPIIWQFPFLIPKSVPNLLAPGTDLVRPSEEFPAVVTWQPGSATQCCS